MYLMKHAYPQAKEILSRQTEFKKGTAALLSQCEADYPHSIWRDVRRLALEGERDRMKRWWTRRFARRPAPKEIEVLWVALWDVPEGFHLRGTSAWSRDPEDWSWTFSDDYSGPEFESPLMQRAFKLTESVSMGAASRGRNAAGSVYEVVEMFFSLVFFGLAIRDVVQGADPRTVLGSRQSRWIVIGHPDSEYGVLIGEMTKDGWRPFVDRKTR